LLTEDLKFHQAFNYKSVDLNNTYKTNVPQGIDCYFDNVRIALDYVAAFTWDIIKAQTAMH